MEVLIRKATKEDKEKMANKPIWEHGVDTFDWYYDTKESCLILEGKANIYTEDGKEFTIQAGDYVEFPEGLKCKWEITEPIKKYYSF